MEWQAPPPAPYAYAPQPYGYEPQPYVQVAYAGFWIRVVGYVIDAVIVGIISFVLSFAIAFVAVVVNPTAAEAAQSPAANAASYLVSLLISFSYYAGQWTMNGQTLGQRWMGLRVVDANTLGTIGPMQAVLRWVGLIVSFLLCFVGVIWVAFDPRKQGLMDKIAGTAVIHD